MRVGAFITPDATDLTNTIEQVVAADTGGLDLVGIQDHPYQPAFLDMWTLMTFAAARTSRVEFVSAVANLPLRPPAMLAKAAASLDLLSGGRVTLGLGTGAFGAAAAAMGGEQRTPGESVDALQEAVAVSRLWWSGQRSVRFPGRYYPLEGVRPGPVPSRRIPIWLGAYKPRMLALTGSSTDGWLPTVPYIDLDADALRSQRLIDEAAKNAGRDPAGIERALIAPLHGRPGSWAAQLLRFHEDYRFDSVLVPVPSGAEGVDLVAQLGDVAGEVGS